MDTLMPIMESRKLASCSLNFKNWSCLACSTTCVLDGLQIYGMTETGVITANDPSRPERCRSGTAGLPLPGYEIDIMDSEGRCLGKTGQAGEICVRGDLVFTGYHGQPELSAASFAGRYDRCCGSQSFLACFRVFFLGGQKGSPDRNIKSRLAGCIRCRRSSSMNPCSMPFICISLHVALRMRDAPVGLHSESGSLTGLLLTSIRLSPGPLNALRNYHLSCGTLWLPVHVSSRF